MTSRAPDRPLDSRLRRFHDAVRRAVVARHALRGLAVCAAALAVAVALGVAWPGGPAAATARLTLFGLAALVALAGAIARVRAETPRFDAWLEQLEGRLPELRSWLRNALDLESRPAGHTSGELAAALKDEAAKRLAASPVAAQAPPVAPRTPLLATAGALVALLALAWLAPRATQRAWVTLWDPGAATPPLELAVEPGSVTLSPGATLAIRARVRGSVAAPRLLGDGPSPAPQLESDAHGERRWRFDLPPVTAPRAYAVRVQRTESPRYRIALAGEPQAVNFRWDLRAPAYARLPVQSGASTRGDLAALAGSVASVEVTFDRDLESLAATLPGGRASAWTAITPRRWRGTVPIVHDGEWTLAAQAASGRGTTRWRLSVLPDAPPVVTVARPEADLDLPAGSQVPYDVQVEDDLGLADLTLQWRKDAAKPWRDVPVSVFREQPREARVTAQWDAAALALLPGESGTFRFEVRDNNHVSGPSVAYSPEFRVRFPSLAELYDKVDAGQEKVQQSLQHVAEQARELQKSLDQMQRTQPRPGMQSPPAFERREEMRKALERQQQLSQQIDKAAQDMSRHVSDAEERKAFHEDLQAKLREMSELMKQIQSPDFKEAVERLKQAMAKMDDRAMEQALPQLREENKDLLKNLERSLALLKQMRDEEKLDALSKRADELKAKQDELNREHTNPAATPKPSPNDPAKSGSPDGQPKDPKQDLADRQREAAKQSEQLAKDARDAAQQMSDPSSKEDLEAAAQELEQNASPQQQQAAQQAQSNQQQKASESGKQASESLQKASQRMNQGNQSAQQERQARQLAAVRRASQDLVSLGREASQSASSPSPSPRQEADRQTDLSEGVARVADSLSALSQETPFLTPQVQQALGRAMSGLSKSGREMAQGNGARGAAERDAARAALTEAVNGLRQTEAGMCNKPGQGGQGQAKTRGAGQRMSELGEKQGQLNQRSKELSQRMTQQMRLSAGDKAEMRRLADEQARLRSELEDIQRDDQTRHQLLGRLDQTRKEMQEVEEQMRSGQPGDDLEEKQTHILSRMLDAQRSLNRRDFDPEREAQRGEDVARSSPAELPAGLMRENDRLRFDLMRAGADRYPAQYRALIERYLQRLNGSPK